MHKVLGLSISAAAIIATGLIPTAAWAATTPSPSATSSTPAAGDPPTTVTFTVTSGALSMTAPAASDLGSGVPGGTISHDLGQVTVTDARALLSAAWTATASATSFTTGTATPAETIPASDVNYNPGEINTTGTITVTGTTVALSGTPKTVVAGTAGVGNNTASWDPGLVVSVPASNAGGLYTGTLTESVS
jgi:hypothetical protein